MTGRPRVGLGTELLYGVGAISSGIKMRALAAFLLIFYNQAVGLSPTTVSLVITIVMVLDAVCDPVVGYISDRLQTPWGRRHPLMYASAAPLALGFVMLWNPPIGWSETALFAWLLMCLVIIRVSDTLFELPSLALAAELVSDYDDRTSIVGKRIFFRTLAGLLVVILGLQVFLRAQADGGGGPADRAGWPAFSLTLAVIMVASILVTCLATHKFIPWLPKASLRVGPAHSPRAFLKDIGGILRNPSALAILGVGAFTAVASGARAGLELYFGLYFWDLSQGQISILALLTAAGALCGALLTPLVSRRFGKRDGTIACYALALIVSTLPVSLRLLGVMPANGSGFLFACLAVEAMLTGVLYVMTAVMMNAMLADVIEDVAARSGQRSEGLLFSADAFFSKAVSGLGVFISGGLLSLIAFPRDVKVHAPDADTLWRLGALYVPTLLVVTSCAIGLLMLFRIDRNRHQDNLARLRAAEHADRVAPLDPPTSIL